MGGGDLNMKKSWHPVLLKNQQRVWEKEQEALEERKRLAQLRKELEEERQLQELQRLQEEQTGKKRTEKLEWMYATPATGSNQNSNDLEDYLLGKKRVDQILIADENAKLGASHKNFIAVQNANTARDIAAKIREDPLFVIKQQEQAAYQALMSNPLRLRELQERNGIKLSKKSKKEGKEEKHAKKKDKNEKRQHKHEKRMHDHRDASRSPSPANGYDSRTRRSASNDRHHDLRASSPHDYSHSRRSPPYDRHHLSRRSPSFDRQRSSRRSPSYERRRPDDHRSRPLSPLPARYLERTRSREREHGHQVLRGRSPNRSRTPSSSPPPHCGRSPSPRRGRDGHHRQYDSRGYRSDAIEDGRHLRSSSHERKRRRLTPSPSTRRPASPPSYPKRVRHSPPPGARPLQASSSGSHAPASARTGNGANGANGADMERAARLAAMTTNATELSVDRQKRLQAMLQAEVAEAAREKSARERNGEAGGFLSTEAKRVYGGMALEERVRRGKGGMVVDAD